MKKSAAIYARVSSDRQREEGTVISQTAALIKYAQHEGYIVPKEWIFEDEGYSGATLVRPGLERLRDLATEGQIDTVLVHSPDRLSRKYAYQVLLCEEFLKQGVEVVFIKSVKAETPEEQLLLQFQGMIAEYERAQIAERSRRGKRHRARSGLVNVLSGAPFGYRYIRKSDISSASYEVIEERAKVVHDIFKLYTEDGISINAIARWLNDRRIPTQKGISRWERSTVWGILRNPAYKGRACFGKTERAERQKVTRPLRKRGGFSPRVSSTRERPKEEWIEVPVPAIVNEETFALAEERLEKNKRFSPRRTVEPTLLQGMLVCGECGYAIYRTSTRTSKRKIYYYRCLGSDAYRHLNGKLCGNRPIRQDYLDKKVWEEVVQLVENPELIRSEISRRIKEIRELSPAKLKKEALIKESIRVKNATEKMLDAYQEGLLTLDELRVRLPPLRSRENTLKSELKSVEATAVDHETMFRLADSIESFLDRLRTNANTLNVTEQQKVLRLIVKEILVYHDTIKIKHSIPVPTSNTMPVSSVSTESSNIPSYLLRSGSHITTSSQYFSPSCPRRLVYERG